MKKTFTVVFFLLSKIIFAQEITVNGIVLDRDSVSPLPYAYAVNKNSGTGTVTDEAGKFSLHARMGDTLAFSYVGYIITKYFTHIKKDSVKNSTLNVKIFLKSKTTELKQVVIATHSFSKEAKQLYEEKIMEYKKGISSPLASPIDAMYYAWSKKGREMQKLSVLYQQLIIDEIKEARISPEKVRVITGNDTLDVKDFLSHCFLPDQFIVSASDYELFLVVKRSYANYMEMHHSDKVRSPIKSDRKKYSGDLFNH